MSVKIEKINDEVTCPLCGPDGKMESMKVNDKTFVYVCDMCPAVLFEYSSKKNTEDLNEYLERDDRKDYRHEREA